MTGTETAGGPEDFAEAVAKATPTPGGGAAAAHAGLLAASLLRMVSGLSLAKAPPPDARGETAAYWRELAALAADAAALAARFRGLERSDAGAFEGYLAAVRLPRALPDEAARRGAAVREATVRATEVPLETLSACLEVLGLARRLLALATRVRVRAESDIGGAVELAHGAFRAAELNVRVNLPGLAGDPRGDALARRWRELAERCERDYTAVRRQALERFGGPPPPDRSPEKERSREEGRQGSGSPMP